MPFDCECPTGNVWGRLCSLRLRFRARARWVNPTKKCLRLGSRSTHHQHHYCCLVHANIKRVHRPCVPRMASETASACAAPLTLCTRKMFAPRSAAAQHAPTVPQSRRLGSDSAVSCSREARRRAGRNGTVKIHKWRTDCRCCWWSVSFREARLAIPAMVTNQGRQVRK